ncbi:MAG: ribonuclease P protein component [Candidatus Niyogibacteria bacterium]|nr:ribonuclease P protein component [Candidatus Niyogibacteria bacterium]
MSLSQNQRLAASEIPNIFKRGGKGTLGGIVIHAAPNRGPCFRLAVIVSSKVEKRSVKRNLLRRRTKEIVRSFSPRMRAGYDVVLVLRATPISFTALKGHIEHLLRKLHIIE